MTEQIPRPPTLKEKVDPGSKGREGNTERVIKLLDKLHVDQTFDTPEHIAEFLQEITYDQLKQLGILVNDFSRGKSGTNDFDGEGVQIQLHGMGSSSVEYIPPDEADKEELLKDVLVSAKKLDLQDSALLLAAGINAVHPFADGNGRASRLIYTLLAEGYDGSVQAREKIANILGPDGREYIDPNPDLVMPMADYDLERRAGIDHKDPKSVTESWSDAGSIIGTLTPEGLPVGEDIDAQSRSKLVSIIESRRFRTLTFYKFLKKQDMLKEPYVNYKESEGRHASFGLPDKRTVVEIDEVLKSLSKEQVEELLKESGTVRKNAVRTLIAFFVLPDKFKFSSGKTIKDYFFDEMNQRRKKEVVPDNSGT